MKEKHIKIAVELKLPAIGLMGILLIAKQKGKLEKIKPVIDDLKNKTSFRISDKLIAEVLKKANE
jgi:predicted nucleic acid-binding protein